MRKFSLVVFVTCIAVLVAAPHEASSKQKIPDGVTFASGGIGDDEEGGMQRMAKDFNLRMQFAVQGTGAYLSDVQVTVTDRKGATVLETVSKGPCLFANVPAGSYKITALYKGEAQKRAVNVSGKRGTGVTLMWPAAKLGEPTERSDDTRKLHRYHGCWK